MNTNNKMAMFYTSILYIFSFFLFMEWLYPLEKITDTRNVTVFIFYAAFCFFLSLFQMKWWISFSLKGIGLLFVINNLYFSQSIFDFLWIKQLIMELGFNLESAILQQWYYLTPTFRSFLFLVLIWLMSYLLHYWVVQMQRMFFFVLLTFIYLTVLDTFTVFDGSISVIRAFIISLAALALANLMKEFNHESLRLTWMKKASAWMIPLIGVIILTTMVGSFVPKPSPQWPDPVPFIYSAAESAGSGSAKGGMKKVGYGEDDSRLGGSFVQDHSPVFTAEVHEAHYWRIETKDVYTGKGWELSANPQYVEQPQGNMELETFSENVQTEELSANIEVDNPSIGKLTYPYGIEHAEEISGVEVTYAFDSVSEAIQTEFPGAPGVLAYEMQYHYPSFAINQLKNSTEEDPRSIKERYTQVPSSLPERVGELAEEVTADYDNRYDKVKAVEGYFSRNGFEYQTTDVPVPEGDDDYVDQFLFESQVGYCDNFSTSMVVMLRTLDIPTRWVKGFTSGDLIENNPSGEPDVYRVTNANAHSWVEVYFPEVGWVPFEPTQGFSNPTEFYAGQEQSGQWTQEESEDTTEDLITEEEEEKQQEKEEEVETAFSQTTDNDGSTGMNGWLYLVVSVIVLTSIALFIYKTRFRWQSRMVSSKLEHTRDPDTFQDAYHYLLKVLKQKGYVKAPDQTLREYADVIDTTFESDEMGRLTSYYERMLYKNEQSNGNMDELTKLWKDLINRIMG
ncbi:transglutaminase TgpA family protein [Oceanobacillus senegalensis]|uniref:transglutaminase TgpA family protein n=1 Tax=Oceanobacillus senegalensis TaxID=1936063 RepID=UPI000A30D371|nr:transglutaminaseTgpA domain-containing protein [Oceanobacillus senegalensis]